MTVRLDSGRIVLEGRCGAEDAEDLLGALETQPDGPVDLAGVTRVHFAVVQILFALSPAILNLPEECPLAADLLAPLAVADHGETTFP
ncbi:hypothetical protein WBP07_24680 [Novosphingobium sp. BL-8A]|uniref:hypothetical protein n=1 Tax=Novosphingobium sp. BL-8A TaxID=3127639 RepID=UPI00375811B7